MNPKLSQEDNDFLDKINEMPFEEAFPIARKLFSCKFRCVVVSQDRRMCDWARDNFKNVQAYNERMAPAWKKEREEKGTKEFAERQAQYKQLTSTLRRK